MSGIRPICDLYTPVYQRLCFPNTHYECVFMIQYNPHAFWLSVNPLIAALLFNVCLMFIPLTNQLASD